MRRLPSAVATAALVASSVVAPSAARAQVLESLADAAPAAGPPVDVAVLQPAHDDRVLVAAAARACLELGASGLTSALVETAGDAYAARLAFVREDGVATIDLLGTLADGSPLNRRVRVPREEGGDDAAVLALRAAELLRGMHLATGPARRAPAPPAAPETVADAEGPGTFVGTTGPVRLFAGAAALESGPGAGLAPGVTFGLAARATPHVSVVVAGAGLFFRDLATTPSGSAHTREELGIVGLRFEETFGRTDAHVLLATGAHHLRAVYDTRGTSMPLPAALHTRPDQSIWSPFVAVGLGASQRFGRRLGVAVEVVAVLLQPALEVTVDRRVVGGLGAPSLLETVDLWMAFP